MFPSVLLSCYHHLKAKNGMYFCPSIFEDFRMVCTVPKCVLIVRLKIPQMPQKHFSQKCLPKPKSLSFLEKKNSLWVSIVRVQMHVLLYNIQFCARPCRGHCVIQVFRNITKAYYTKLMICHDCISQLRSSNKWHARET